MPRGHSLSIYARFLGKKRTSVYISRQKGDILLHPSTAQRSFFRITIFFWENIKKNWPEKRASILMRVYRIVLMPPGLPMILLKSKLLNMAAVSVKRSIKEVFFCS